MDVRPFRGLRPRPDLASRIPSLPYDVLDSDEARKLAAGDAHTFLHVVKPEIDLDPSIDPHDEQVYARGTGESRRDALVRLARAGSSSRRSISTASAWGRTRRPGSSGAAAVADYLGRPHQAPRAHAPRQGGRPDAAHAGARRAAGTLCSSPTGIGRSWTASSRSARRSPGVGFHRGRRGPPISSGSWTMRTPVTVHRERARPRSAASYVADGHHRAGRPTRGPRVRRAGSWPCISREPARDPRLQPDRARSERPRPGEVSPRRAGRGVRDREPVGREASAAERDVRDVSRRRVALARSERPGGARRLDPPGPAPRAGARCRRPSYRSRIAFVGGGRGLKELERRVDSGNMPSRSRSSRRRWTRWMAVADAGEVMPPKSTWFEPKLRSGIVVRLSDDD
jgi:hypothetical protein